MESCFEKLKKGMGVEIYEREPRKTKKKPEKKLPQDPDLKLRAGQTTQVSSKKRVRKLKVEPRIEKIKKPGKIEEREEPEKIEEVKESKEAEKKTEVEEDKSSSSPFATSRVKEESKIELDKEERPENLGQKFALKKLAGQEGQLAVDVYQTETELVIQSAIAGIKTEDLDISIESDSVIIRGIREHPPETGEKNYFYQECYWGQFSRQIILPEETDPGRAEATMKEGILTIRIPKIEKKEKKKILVKPR